MTGLCKTCRCEYELDEDGKCETCRVLYANLAAMRVRAAREIEVMAAFGSPEELDKALRMSDALEPA